MRTVEVIDDGAVRPPDRRRECHKPGPRKGTKLPDANRAMGESNGAAVLTAKDVRRLRELAANGVLQKELAKRYGIAAATVSRIVTRKLWPHV